MFIFQKRTFVRRKEASTSGALACLLAMMRTKSAASMCSRGMIISWFAIFDQVPWNLVYFACMNFKTQGKSRKIRLFHLLVGIWIFAPKLRPLFLTSLAYYYLERQDFCAAAFRRRSSPWWCWTKVHSSSSLGVPPKHLNFGKSGQSQSVNYVSFLVVPSFSSSLSVYLDFSCCNLSYRHFCSKAVSSLPNLYELTSILAIGHSLVRWHSRPQLSWWKKQNHSLWTSMSEDHAPLDNP